MAKYTVTNGSSASAGTQQNITTTYVSGVIGLTGANASPRRNKIYDIMVGANGTPSDSPVEWDLSRITANSTSTTVAPPPLDAADAAATTIATINSSQAGTISVPNMWYVGINERASYRWVAAPGSELVAPATSSAGFQLRARSATSPYASTVTATILFEEQ